MNIKNETSQKSKSTSARSPEPAAPTAKAKKEKPKKSNKSAFVRSLDPAMPAAKVVELAKAQGIELSPAFVYSIRSTSKLTRSTLRGAGKAQDATRSRGGMTSAESQLRHAIADLGLVRATEILESVKKAIRKG